MERKIATISNIAFTKNPDFRGDKEVWTALGGFASQPEIQSKLKDAKRITILAIPSLAHRLISGESIDVHGPISEETGRIIIEALGLSDRAEDLSTMSITDGGASIVGALNQAREIVCEDPDTTVVIVGAERLSSLSTGDLIRAAGNSVLPSSLYGSTLLKDIGMNLFSGYGLRESDVFSGGVYKTYRDKILRMRGFNGKPFSGDICKPEIARSDDGAIVAIVEGAGKSNAAALYIAGGFSNPIEHIPWYELPAKHNMALVPAQNIIRAMDAVGVEAVIDGRVNPDILLEMYECFFIARIQQMSALLGHGLINEENFGEILDALKSYNPLSTLSGSFASWGISSAEKLDLVLKELVKGNHKGSLIFGNGGVMDTITIAFLVANPEVASRFMDGSEFHEKIIRHPLITNPGEIVGKDGLVVMKCFQQPHGNTPGTTFVGVEVNGARVLTNLMVKNAPTTLHRDLSKRTSIGTTVEFIRCPFGTSEVSAALK